MPLCAQTSDLASMDFATRNLYRSAIEALSRRSLHTELEVTHALIVATSAVSDSDPDAIRKRDPGYHLLGRGRRAFERVIGYRAPLSNWLRVFYESLGPARLHRLGPRSRSDRSCCSARCAVRAGNCDTSSGGVCALRPDSGNRCGSRAGESCGHARLRRNDVAGPGAARRRAREHANDDRSADAADDARSPRNPARATRGALPGLIRRRAAFCTALGLDRRRDGKHTRR